MANRLIILLFFISALLAGEPQKVKRYNLSVCALFTNESKYLKEWIEYHRLIGVDHFYLYDNNSKDRFRSILNPYIKKEIVTLISWPDYFPKRKEEIEPLWSLSTMAAAYEHAIHYQCVEETNWLAILNINEFLVPMVEENLTEILKRYENFPGIILPSNYYDASKQEHHSNNRLIIESFHLTIPSETARFKTVEKTIFKPELVSSFSWPPIRYKFKNRMEAKAINPFEAKVNDYENRGFWTSPQKTEKLFIDNRAVPQDKIREILKKGYEVEDEEKNISRFVPKLRQKLGFLPDVN